MMSTGALQVRPLFKPLQPDLEYAFLVPAAVRLTKTPTKISINNDFSQMKLLRKGMR